jgi:phage gp16-like protein
MGSAPAAAVRGKTRRRHGRRRTAADGRRRRPLLRADKRFAKLGEQGVGAAFGAFAAPDAAMFGSRGIAAVRRSRRRLRRLAPATRLEWKPVWLDRRQRRPQVHGR